MCKFSLAIFVLYEKMKILDQSYSFIVVIGLLILLS